MVTATEVIGRIEILEDGQIQVRRDTVIVLDGVEIARTFHRYVLDPGADLTDQDPRVQAHATTAWTPDVVSAFTAALPPSPTPPSPVTTV